MNRQEKFIIMLSLGIFLLALLGLRLIPRLLESMKPTNSNYIGMVLEAKGDTKIRFGDSVNWRNALKKDPIYSKAYLFTGENSSGTFAFLDESALSLGPNTLIYIDIVLGEDGKPKKQNKSTSKNELVIELVDGEMKIDLKNTSLIKSLKVEDASIGLTEKNSVVKLKYNNMNGMEVSVMKGNINIQTKDRNFNVKHGERLEVLKKDETIRTTPVPTEVMDEMKKMSEIDRRILLEELQRKRGLGQIIQEVANFLTDN